MPQRLDSATAPYTTIVPGNAPPGARTPRSHARGRPARREITFLAALALLVVAAVEVARSGWYTAGSDVGYWLGVAGGVAMLTLFTYPLRKRWRAMRDIGATRFWFALHMALGICGPLLIVLHSTLAFGSLNATIAFASMAIVAASGVVGRYLYGRIHHGLYGRRETLAELQAQAGLDAAGLHSRLAFIPAVELRLIEFALEAEETSLTGLARPLRFLTLGMRAMLVRRSCIAATARVLDDRAQAEGWSPSKLERRISGYRAFIATYLRAVQRVAQFSAFERLFSWWHILHVPLVFMLLLSAIAHVIAVHMY